MEAVNRLVWIGKSGVVWVVVRGGGMSKWGKMHLGKTDDRIHYKDSTNAMWGMVFLRRYLAPQIIRVGFVILWVIMYLISGMLDLIFEFWNMRDYAKYLHDGPS